MSWNNNGANGGPVYQNNNNGYQKKADDPTKVSFSSVKLGQTKQGSPTMGMFLKRDQMEKLYGILTELLNSQAGQDGCKIAAIVISGEKYDSGYAYVGPKMPPQQRGSYNNYGNAQTQNTQQTGQTQQRPSYGRQEGPFADKQAARTFIQNKRLPEGETQG